MRVIVTGSRHWRDYDLIRAVLSMLPRDSVIVHGVARGADALADRAARELGMTVEAHPADWARYGRRAGPMRNQAMVDSGADMVLAFHDSLESSRGTRDCVRRARAQGMPVVLICHPKEEW